MNRNYMVIRPEKTNDDSYTIRMLCGNQIQGLLPFQDKRVNDEVCYYYDITSKQPLSRMLEHRTIAGEELRTFLTELLYTLKRMERFLLDEGQLDFHPEFIYIDPNSFKGSFCLIPGKHQEFASEFCELSQYLLDHVNQNDGEAVLLAFSVFRECRKLNFGMEDIEQCLRKLGKENQYQTVEDWLEVKKKSEEYCEDLQGKRVRRRNRTIEKSKEDKQEETEKCAEIMEATEKSTEQLAGKWLLYGIGGVMAAFPFGLYFCIGLDGVYHWKWGILAGELLLGILEMSIFILMYRENGERTAIQVQAEEEPWEVIFQEDDIEAAIRENETGNEMEEDSKKELQGSKNEMQTVLLSTAKPIQREGRKLIPRNGEIEIPVNYFPFIIGKNKGIVDFCLNRPEVSRLHVKIEKTEDGYTVTDLNSTNGTRVNGICLEANETTSIQIGDELTIASEVYIFR